MSLPDARPRPDELERQAIIAAEHGNPALAAALRRTAELARLPWPETGRVRDALCPHRSTEGGLTALAAWLDARGCPLTAALIRDTRDLYAREGLLRADGFPGLTEVAGSGARNGRYI
ncbi:diol dehydratase small subunit [Spongiactinospora sp. TRM90649]|uniref:diol dehydratase small subunit n=1 Tax=Spongiactinospora sp. TRM90649 TaxID=3031114 RepID=UPI0023F89D00|nr:diol dehydratase small subunit [Spongiactinospora sp. TRM90649]MDF5752105.1 diol dehydratase small subunit [Spongiactinospora sp. TRM90649]